MSNTHRIGYEAAWDRALYPRPEPNEGPRGNSIKMLDP